MKTNALLAVILLATLIWGPFTAFQSPPVDVFIGVISWVATSTPSPLSWTSQVSHLFFFYLVLALMVLMSAKLLK